MNTNLIHNILNIAIVIIAALAGFDWVAVGIEPAVATQIVAVLGGLKLVINALRDGLTGLWKQQPPVR